MTKRRKNKAAPAAGRPATSPPRIVVTVHGIRTFGQWQNRLRALLAASDPDIGVQSYQYGYFSVIAFVLPMFRWLAVRAFRRKTKALFRNHPSARFCFVAHSFGTHLVAHGLKGLRGMPPDIETIILAGSVLRSQFDWDGFLTRVPAKRVVNDCGINDSVLVLSQFAVLFTGMAGRSGFYGYNGDIVLNRFFAGGHSHYFQPADPDVDSFMRQFWLPLLTSDQAPDLVEQRAVPSLLMGLQSAFLRIADPLKIAGYLLLGWIVLNTFYFSPRREAQTQQAAREIAVAANLLEAGSLLPESYAAMSRLLAEKRIPDPKARSQAAMIAAFAGQRLVLLDRALAVLQPGNLFRWSGSTYLKAEAPMRLGIAPVAYRFFPESSRIVTVDADSSVTLIDSRTGAALAREKIEDGAGKVVGSIDFYSLAGASQVMALDFRFSPPNDDDSRRYAVEVGLSEPAIRILDRGEADVGVMSNASCTAFAGMTDDDDDGDLTPEQQKRLKEKQSEEHKFAAKCLVALQPDPISRLTFPSAVDEESLWTSRARASAPTDDTIQKPCAGVMEAVQFPARVRYDYHTLDFSLLPTEGTGEGTGGFVRDEVAKFFGGPEEEGPGCFVEFEAGGHGRYILNLGYVGNWHVGYILCRIDAAARVERCAGPGFAWNGSGKLWMSDGGAYLALAGYGSQEGSAWSLIDLGTLEVLWPEKAASDYTVGIAFASGADIVAVASLIPGLDGAVEVWVYRLDPAPKLIARRMFEAPQGYSSADPNVEDPVARSVLLAVTDGFVLATPFQQIFAFRLSDYGLLPAWLTRFWERLSGREAAPRAILLDWTSVGGGFPANALAQYALPQEKRFLAAYAGSKLRLLSLLNGKYLTPLVNIAGLPQCDSDIRDVEIGDNQEIVAKTDSCSAYRAAPLSAEALREISTDARSLLAEGMEVDARLPGERRVHP